MKQAIVVTLFLLIGASCVAIAQKSLVDTSESVSVFYWANDLNGICQMDSPMKAGMELPPSTNTFLMGDVMRKFMEFKTDQGMCVGYILGRAEALTEMNDPEAVRTAGKVCFPMHNPGDELVGAVKEKLAKESILHDKQIPASVAVNLALKELYPCPTKP